MKKRRFLQIFCCVLILSLLAGCSGYISYSFDKKEFEIVEGQGFILTYEEDLSKGSAWECHFRGGASFEIIKDERSKTFFNLFQKDAAKRKIWIKAAKEGEGVIYLVRQLQSSEQEPYETRQINVTITPRKVLGNQ